MKNWALIEKVKTVAIVSKPGASYLSASVNALSNFLSARGYGVICDAGAASALGSETHASGREIAEGADLAIVIGGDGTMLGFAREMAGHDVPLIGVNQGRVGFITDVAHEGMLTTLAAMLDGHIEVEQRSLLDGVVTKNGEAIFHATALNDVVVSRGRISGMVELRVEVNGKFMYNQRSDGLIVATPTGSSAYALAAGGPLLHPAMNGVVLVPIAPHALSNRPIVLDDSSEIVIDIVGGKDAAVHFDMQSLSSVEVGNRIVVRRSERQITFLHPEGWNYFETLRNKLHWNEHI
jgi:NAD+ kinase